MLKLIIALVGGYVIVFAMMAFVALFSNYVM